MIKRLLKDESGIIREGIIAITFIMLSSMIWLICALILNRTFDALLPILSAPETDPRALPVSQQAVNAFGVSIIIIDALLLIWWGLSAQKTETQEYAAP